MFNYIALALTTASFITSSTLYTPAIFEAPRFEKESLPTLASQNPATLTIKKPVKYVVRNTHKMWVTAYTSRPEETDSTPFITASGSYVHNGIVATNALPIGTLIRIPEHFGDRIFRVEDRMNARYTNNIDVWFEGLKDARKFGKKYTTIEVL